MLVRLENPQTQVEYINRLVWKLFLFGFLNSYNAFLYISLFQRWRSASLASDLRCPNDDCIELLRTSLASTYCTLGAMSILGMAQPYLTMWWQIRSEDKKVQQKLQERIKGGSDEKDQIIKRAFMERQGKMWVYEIDEYITDFLDLVVAVGYTLLFASVVPIVVIIALAILLVRLRADAWKLCSVYRRTWAFRTSGIGAWNDVLELLSWLGLMTSVAIPVLNMKAMDGYTLEQKFLIFFGIEHILILAKVVTGHSLTEVSPSTKLMMDRRQYVEDTMRDGKQSKKPVPDHRVSKAEHFEKSVYLNQDHPEWQHLEHSDDEVQARVRRRLNTGVTMEDLA